YAAGRTGGREQLVVDRIEHGYRLAVDVDRVGDVHVAAERAADALRDDGLAVARRTVQEQRFARVHRRSEPVVHLRVDDQLRESARKRVAVDPRTRRHRRTHVRRVLRERHGRGTDIAIDVEELHRTLAAEVRLGVAIAGRARAARAAHFDELFDAGVLDQRVE